MKTSILFMLTLVFCFSGCSSQKKLVKNAPFEMGQATVQKQLPGREGSATTVKLNIPIDKVIKEGYTLNSVFFRGKVAKISVTEVDGKKVAVAKFKDEKMKKPDIIMHSDPKQEVGNQPPPLNKTMDFPFEINDNEAVLSYIKGEKVKYFKVPEVKELSPKAHR